MYRCLLAVIAAIILASAGVRSSELEDATPKVDPARIKDVPPRNVPLDHFFNFSWLAFVALNWPALPGAANRGKADTSKKFADSGPRVWETWKARHEVFAPDAREPGLWNEYAGANPCGGVNSEIKTLSAFNHFADFNQALATLGSLGNPLVAQNRTYTRYEVRVNEEHFDTIKQYRWHITGNLPTRENPGTFKNGSIQIKAAWRILNDHDSVAVRKRYYVRDALVFDPDATKRAGSVVCTKQDVALVGFHIVIKTPKRPQWIWSSFEHVDNVPPHSDEPDAEAAGVPYSYHSGHPPDDLSPTDAPVMITEENYVSNPVPMQVVRKQRIRTDVMDMNKAYWALPEIKGTIWEKYMLVMTQWPTNTHIPPSPDSNGFPHPRGLESTLANTTMETYQQRARRSCMECHHEAANKRGMDFVAYMGMLLSRRR